MQQALQYRDWLSSTAGPPPVENQKPLAKLVAENAVVVVAKKGCCMCHVVELLLHGHGANPMIIVLEEENEAGVISEFTEMMIKEGSGKGDVAPELQLPAVFVGGKMFGGLEEVMAAHISGELVPRLRQARALWL